MNTLIAYASKYGYTEKCASLLKNELKGHADLINLKKVKNIDLSDYENVVIGGSVYIGKIQKEVTKFCEEHLRELKEKRTGLFICGMAKDEDIEKEINTNFPAKLLESAIVKDSFGGEFDFNKMNFLEKKIVRTIAKTDSDIANIRIDKIHEFAQAML